MMEHEETNSNRSKPEGEYTLRIRKNGIRIGTTEERSKGRVRQIIEIDLTLTNMKSGSLHSDLMRSARMLKALEETGFTISCEQQGIFNLVKPVDQKEVLSELSRIGELIEDDANPGGE